MMRAFAVLMNLDKASMGVNRNTCLATPSDRRHLKTLTYGQFYGVIEQRHELHRFSVSLVAANDISIKRKKHSHDSAHIILILEGQYISAPPRLEHCVLSVSLWWDEGKITTKTQRHRGSTV